MSRSGAKADTVHKDTRSCVARVRVATWNVHFLGDDTAERLADVIRGSGADIVGLQEVCSIRTSRVAVQNCYSSHT